MNIAMICISLLGLLVFIGGFHVSFCRAGERVVQGYPDDPSNRLHKAVRAHGNTVEYAPMLALLIYIASQLNAPTWVTVCMVLATLSRISIYFGLLFSPTLDKPHPLRFTGALGTYIFGGVLCLYLLISAVY